MGQSIIEKIIQAHSTDEVKPGEIVWIDLDVRSARDFAGANVVQNLEKYYPNEKKIANLDKTCFTFDCVVPANNVGYAQNQQIIRQFARKEGIKLFDVNAGIGSHVLIDEGIAIPGSTVVGTDSHLNIMGAIGAFGQGMGDQDIAFGFKAGKTWFEVPPTMKVVYSGAIPNNCDAKDMTLATIGKLGSKGALGRSVEFEGKSIDNLSLDGRITLASQVTEMGGIIGLIPPSSEVLEYCNAKAGRSDLKATFPDSDVEYVETVEIDLSTLEPLIACPFNPSNVKPVKEVAGTKVDAVIVGSCTNGRKEDIIALASVLKGRKIADHVMMKVVAATREIYKWMLKEGYLETIFDAGAIVSHPGCASCAQGQLGMTGEGEIQISTGNRNFKGKQGKGQTYLTGPRTAAACAVAGEIIAADKL